MQKSNSFLEALHNKYALGVAKEQTHLRNSTLTEGSTIVISGKEVEEVGFDKIRQQQSNLSGLSRVILEGERIHGTSRTSIGARQALHESISRTCASIIELDLGRNLFETWDDIADICCPLKKLKALRTTGNRFSAVSWTTYPGRDPFHGVMELVLDETLLVWDEVVQITHTASFPSLVDLSFAANELSTVSTPLDTINLTSLNLNDNLFTDLASLKPLTSLPHLSRLALQGNNIISNSAPSSLSFSTTLYQVNLSRNAISSWSFTDLLPSIFPGITSLKISNNPLYELPVSTVLTPLPPTATSHPPPAMTIEEAFMLTLSRISSLLTLNYSTIKPADRQNAELFYLNGIIAKEMQTATDPSAEASILARHPRYGELCEIYGAPTVVRKDAVVGAGVNPRSLQARLLRFSFYMADGDNEENGGVKQCFVEIPRTVDVYVVKAIVARHFKLPALGFKLIHETEELDPVYEADDRWSDDDDVVEGTTTDTKKWVRREVELVDSVRDVGSFLDDDAREVRVRVEPSVL